MAREIVVRIINETEARPSADLSSEDGDKKKPKTDDSGSDFLKVMWAYLGKRIITRIKTEAMYYTGKYFDVTENYKASNLVDNASSTIDMATSLFVGAKVGTHVLGAGLGTGIGLAVTAIGMGVGAVKKYGEEAQKIAQNAYGNYFYGTRAGYVDGGHGTEN